jgi:hypothetical protein
MVCVGEGKAASKNKVSINGRGTRFSGKKLTNEAEAFFR